MLNLSPLLWILHVLFIFPILDACKVIEEIVLWLVVLWAVSSSQYIIIIKLSLKVLDFSTGFCCDNFSLILEMYFNFTGQKSEYFVVTRCSDMLIMRFYHQILQNYWGYQIFSWVSHSSFHSLICIDLCHSSCRFDISLLFYNGYIYILIVLFLGSVYLFCFCIENHIMVGILFLCCLCYACILFPI